MSYLLSVARPQIGVITALGQIPVHVEFFAGPEGVAREKEKLISQLPSTGTALLNADDPRILEMKRQTRAHVITYGFDEAADMRISGFEESFEEGILGIAFKLNYGGSFIPVKMSGALGRTQSYAAAAAAVAGLIFGMNLVKISESFTDYNAPSGRMKVILGVKENTLIDVTYNASPLSMEEALQTLKRIKAKRKIAILGDMLELGKYTLEAHEAVGGLSAKSADLLITVGGRAKFIADAALKAGMEQNSVFAYDNVRDAAQTAQKKIQKGDLVLVKGSQGARMEKIVKEIMENPQEAEKMLVRQSKVWQKIKGLYD
jgi:UDP-N-acetylmuramoyl-tripeptide--D-alanyl-D-alanine ligase